METPKRAEAAAAVWKFMTKSPAQLIDQELLTGDWKYICNS